MEKLSNRLFWKAAHLISCFEGHFEKQPKRQVLAKRTRQVPHPRKVTIYLIKKALWYGFGLPLAWSYLILTGRVEDHRNYAARREEEKRMRQWGSPLGHLPTSRSYRILFISGLPRENSSNRYRVENLRSQLRLCGVESDFLLVPEVWQKIASQGWSWLGGYDILFIFRAAMDPSFRELVNLAKKEEIIIVYSLDDFIFDSKILRRYVDGYRLLNSEERKKYARGVRGYRKLLKVCSYFLATTNSLKAEGEKSGLKSFVIRNGLNEAQIEESEKALQRRKRFGKGEVRIGYFSGTKTHQKDFATCAPAILKLMKEYPKLKFYIGGYLKLDRRFARFKEQIVKLPFVDWKKLPYNLAKIDIQVVPLELNNPFTDCKSELKYFEAALLKIPTVASATSAYKFAIRNGENGFLAESSDDWYRHLKTLIEDEHLRKEIGERAYKHSLATYTPQAQAKDTKEVFEAIIADYRRKKKISPRALSISWVIPAPFVGSGGHRNIFRAVKYLTQFGHRCRIYVTPNEDFKTSVEVRKFINDHFMKLNVDVILGVENIISSDALIATHWTTAYVVDRNRSRAAKCFYFIQDYEPYFAPMGHEYLAAENTYRLGFIPITSGPWPARILWKKHRLKAGYFRFPVRTHIYYPREARRKKQVIFLARPDMPRRCFPLGIEALRIFKAKNPKFKVILFGSDKIDPARVGFPHKNLGVLTDQELARLYSSSMVGIAFSTTNPSLVPFEMMACKCPVVDLDYGDNVVNYGSKRNVTLAEPTPERVAEVIEKLVSDESLRKAKAENAYKFVKSFPDEKETVRRIEELILKEFRDESEG